MADEPLRPGDVVELKSGGPRMTITSIRNDEANVAWFDDEGEQHETGFKVVALRKADGSEGRPALTRVRSDR
jgi:uncharacterized protein YodC (DUF2158 family)